MKLNEKTLTLLSKSRIDFGGITFSANTDFTKEQICDLRDKICDEIVTVGLEENDEPNSYGLFLESIIDDLGHYL